MIDRIILFPYSLTLKVRHFLFDKGIRKVHRSAVPSVCIGNITAGGTGKTPHTEMILRTLLDSDEWAWKNIAVLSRGHKRSSRGFQQVTPSCKASFSGDEPLQVKKKFPGATVAVDRDRIEGCDFLCNPGKLKESRKGRRCEDKEFAPADLIVLDDAYQYRALQADFNIVLIDYNRPIYKDMLLPFGRLRDLPERALKADVLIVTKCPGWLDDWEKASIALKLGVRDYSATTCQGTLKDGRKKTVLFTAIEYCPLQPVFEEADLRYMYSQRMILFSGIAKDTHLRRYLGDKYNIVKRFRFGDHHRYSRMDIARIRKAAEKNPTAVLATTEKDTQRLLDVKEIPETIRKRVFQVPIKVTFLSETEEEVFRKTLLESAGLLREASGSPSGTSGEKP